MWFRKERGIGNGIYLTADPLGTEWHWIYGGKELVFPLFPELTCLAALNRRQSSSWLSPRTLFCCLSSQSMINPQPAFILLRLAGKASKTEKTPKPWFPLPFHLSFYCSHAWEPQQKTLFSWFLIKPRITPNAFQVNPIIGCNVLCTYLIANPTEHEKTCPMHISSD